MSSQSYRIARAPSGWLWVMDKNGDPCRSKRTGKTVAFRSIRGAQAYIKDIIRNQEQKKRAGRLLDGQEWDGYPTRK